MKIDKVNLAILEQALGYKTSIRNRGGKIYLTLSGGFPAMKGQQSRMDSHTCVLGDMKSIFPKARMTSFGMGGHAVFRLNPSEK